MEEASSIPGANTMDNNSSRQYESILAQTECCTYMQEEEERLPLPFFCGEGSMGEEGTGEG